MRAAPDAAPGGHARHACRERCPFQPGAHGIGDVRARHRAVRVRRVGGSRRGRRQVALGRTVARQPGAAGARGGCRHAQQRRAPGSRPGGVGRRRPPGTGRNRRARRREHLGPLGFGLRVGGRDRRGGRLLAGRLVHRCARGQRQLPERRGPFAHVRPLGGGDVPGPRGHCLRPAALGQAQPERAGPGGDRHRRGRGRR